MAKLLKINTDETSDGDGSYSEGGETPSKPVATTRREPTYRLSADAA